MSDEPITCTTCGTTFTLSQAVRDKFPGWTPKTCMKCKKGGGGAAKSGAAAAKAPARGGARRPASSGSAEENLTTAQVLERYTEGPTDGVFTDGSSIPNPGPGGWGAVYVRGGEVVAQRHGHERDTTNNRMELTALIHAFDLVPPGTAATVFTDSNLAVQTINDWAAGWEKRGWTRKTGPIQNLDLIKVLYAKSLARPDVKLTWIKAHNGSRWNEYADSLSTAWMRDEV